MAQEKLIQKAYGAEGAMKAQYASMLAGKNGLSGFLALVNSSEGDFDKLTKLSTIQTVLLLKWQA